MIRRLETCPGDFTRLDVVLADIGLREAALDLAKRRRANRRYAWMVRAFAEIDGEAATIARMALAPQPRASRRWRHL